jgi:hypothetical protein
MQYKMAERGKGPYAGKRHSVCRDHVSGLQQWLVIIGKIRGFEVVRHVKNTRISHFRLVQGFHSYEA